MATDPDVCLVVLDSLRKDRTSLYGRDRATTPALDRLARRATTYADAHVPAPWTLPSHWSVFTGLAPSEHGATNGFADAAVGPAVDAPTLTELLADRGYHTAGFSNNPWVGALSGLDRGFDEFVEWNLEIGRESGAPIHSRTDRLLSRGHALVGHAARQPVFALKRPFFTARLVERARRWLRTAGDPTFTFCNLMEAHSPYFPPRRAFRELGLDPPGPVEPRLLNTRLLAYTMGRLDLTAARRERALEFYDAAVRYQDGKLATLVDDLEATGRFDDALVVVCADHGKTLGEYDRDATPPHYLREVNASVPLVVKYPGQATADRVDDPVELARLFDVCRDPTGPRLEARADGPALTEEFVPHTGRTTADVTRWRALSGPDRRLLRADDGREFLSERGEGVLDETVVDAGDDGRSDALRRRLDDRVEALTDAPAAAGTDPAPMRGDVESQLEDLGYLE